MTTRLPKSGPKAFGRRLSRRQGNIAAEVAPTLRGQSQTFVINRSLAGRLVFFKRRLERPPAARPQPFRLPIQTLSFTIVAKGFRLGRIPNSCETGSRRRPMNACRSAFVKGSPRRIRVSCATSAVRRLHRQGAGFRQRTARHHPSRGPFRDRGVHDRGMARSASNHPQFVRSIGEIGGVRQDPKASRHVGKQDRQCEGFDISRSIMSLTIRKPGLSRQSCQN